MNHHFCFPSGLWRRERMMERRPSVRAACIFVLTVALGLPARASDLVIGQAAPAITLHTLGGGIVNSRDLQGKVVILTFWATWCGPCREELPTLSRYAAKHAKEGLVVLGFSLDTPDDLEQVKSIARNLSFPVGLLGDPHVPGYGRIWHLPVNFTIDRNGRLVDNGWKDPHPVWTAERLEKVVSPLLEPAHVRH